MRGGSGANVRFGDLCALLHALGFEERTRGGHHIFSKPGVIELINLQRAGHDAKRYQVRQVRILITTYELFRLIEDD